MKTSSLAIALVSLLIPAAAAAKEPVKVTVCGSSACHSTKDRTVLAALSEGGPPTNPPRHAAPWYRSTVAIGGADGEHGRFNLVVLPAQGLMATRDVGNGNKVTWMPMSPAGAHAYRALSRGLAPRPAETLTGLGDTLPPAHVSETVNPPSEDSGGIDAWTWVLTGAVAFSVLAAWGFRRRQPPASARGAAPRP